MKILPFLMLPMLAGCGVREANLARNEANSQMYALQVAPSALQRKLILDHVRDNYFDPYSIRDAEISNSVSFSEVTMNPDSEPKTPLVCVKANAKNRMGGYTGRKNELYQFNPSGSLKTVSDDLAGRCDSRMQFLPFPELEQMKSISQGKS
jgi:hypothetical protein